MDLAAFLVVALLVARMCHSVDGQGLQKVPGFVAMLVAMLVAEKEKSIALPVKQSADAATSRSPIGRGFQ